jgi:hypothetical protein
MFVTRHSNVVDRTITDRLWQLYVTAYQPTVTETVTREMLYRSEFDETLADPLNRVWLLWDEDQPVAILVIATDASATRYLSREYFERNFADHAQRAAIHYLIWMVVHPQYVTKGSVLQLAKDCLQLEAAEGALLVFDAPQMNQRTERGGVLEMMRRLAAAVVGGAPVRELEVHRWYAADFARPAPPARVRGEQGTDAAAEHLSRT